MTPPCFASSISHYPAPRQRHLHCPCTCNFLYLLLFAVAFFATTAESRTTTTTITTTSTIYTITRTISTGFEIDITTTISRSTRTYATTATITSAIPTMPAGSGNGVYSGDKFKSAVMNSTNFFREQHLVQPLQWDPKLAQYAQNYAEKCMWEHSGGPHGENLAEGYPNPTIAVDAWAAEEKTYDYVEREFTEAAGHFTQLVWKNSKRVGCGAVNCDDKDGSAHGWMMVCEYDPPGNVEGSFGENVRKAGQSEDGTPGMGAAAGLRSSWVLVALVAVSSLAAGCL